MTISRAVSLADQTVELTFPSELGETFAPLFRQDGCTPHASPDHRIDVTAGAPGRYAIRVDDQPVGDAYAAPDLIEVVLDETVRCLITDLGTAVALHAASVGWLDRSVLIAGASGTGKTSLTGWFVAKGFDFLSDELVLLQEGQTTLSFPRPLVAKPDGRDVVDLLTATGRARAVPAGSNTLLDLGGTPANQLRRAGLVIFPYFAAGGELVIEAVSTATAVARLMGCNLNGRNLADHGLRAVAALCRNVPALALTYGSFDQLDGVADVAARLALENDAGAQALRNFIADLGGGAAAITRTAVTPPADRPIPEPTPRGGRRKLTIGMAAFDDDGDAIHACIQATRLRHPEVLDDVEFLVLDDNPRGRHAEALKALESTLPNYRYVPRAAIPDAAVRDLIFAEASGDVVLCLDRDVSIAPGALARLIAYCDARPASRDLLHGPLVGDETSRVTTHMDAEWRAGRLGTWRCSPFGVDPDAPPFEITMQDLGLFACRRAAWPGLNPAFRGIGGEEGYIHERIRRHGGRVLCLPFLRWSHATRGADAHDPGRRDDRIRNAFVGFRALGWNTAPVAAHFRAALPGEAGRRLVAQAEDAARHATVDDAIVTAETSDAGNCPDAAVAFASVWDPAAKAQQLGLLARVLAAADAHRLPLYLFWGTLLGHVRESGLLPWDDDVDLAVFDPDRAVLAAFRAALAADGLQTFDKTQGADVWIKVCDPAAPIKAHHVPWTWPFIDIFIYASDASANPAGWPVLPYPHTLALPGRPARFEGLQCREPEQPLALLDLKYPGWRRREVSSGWHHRWETAARAVAVRLIDTDDRGRKLSARPAHHNNPFARDVFLPLLRAWIDIAGAHDIPYSIFWGTLLGQLRNQHLIAWDRDVDVVVGRTGMEILHALPGRVDGCVYNDGLKDLPPWRDHEIRLVVRRDLDTADGPRFDHQGEQVATQVDACAFNGPMARLVLKLPESTNGRAYWHLDVDLFTEISRFNPYPVRAEVDELPELEQRPLEGLLVSCLKDGAPYLIHEYGADYLIPDRIWRDGTWVRRD